jgi:C1A family cysteine protease
MKTLIFSLLFLTTTCFGQNKFGWMGDSPGKRMPQLRTQQWPVTTPAASSDLTKRLPKVYDQQDIGSCVANGTLSAYSYVSKIVDKRYISLSRLQVYYDARKSIGMVNVDSGCQIVDAVNNLQKIGAGHEYMWPYITNKFTQKPPTRVYQNAVKHKVIQAFKVDNTDRVSIRLALTNGYPVIVGSLVYNGIHKITSSNYILEMPKAGERWIGGHCYLITGHDDAKQLFRGRNSWGKNWGKDGDFLLPYAYIHSGRITEDCWVIVNVMQ